MTGGRLKNASEQLRYCGLQSAGKHREEIIIAIGIRNWTILDWPGIIGAARERSCIVSIYSVDVENYESAAISAIRSLALSRFDSACVYL